MITAFYQGSAKVLHLPQSRTPPNLQNRDQIDSDLH